MKFTKQAAASVADGYNEVNGKAEVIKIENRDYDALENIILTLKIKNGWDYTVSPAEALKAAGASDALATYIKNYIETEEGGTNGSYEIEQKLTASVSGNHVLLYGSKRMVPEQRRKSRAEKLHGTSGRIFKQSGQPALRRHHRRSRIIFSTV